MLYTQLVRCGIRQMLTMQVPTRNIVLRTAIDISRWIYTCVSSACTLYSAYEVT